MSRVPQKENIGPTSDGEVGLDVSASLDVFSVIYFTFLVYHCESLVTSILLSLDMLLVDLISSIVS